MVYKDYILFTFLVLITILLLLKAWINSFFLDQEE